MKLVDILVEERIIPELKAGTKGEALDEMTGVLVAAHPGTTATAVDNTLWHRGGERRYKAHPRHRARTTAY